MRIRLLASASLMCVIAVAGASAQVVTRPDTSAAEVIPRYRYRILGLYDDRTGDPIEDADVIDVLSGNSVKTTSTGTASLLFLPDGGGLVRIRKLGYELTTQMIGISADDTLPVTLVLKRVQELPTVVTVDSAPKYVSPTLRGFEDRRRNHDAGYFMSELQIRKDGSRPLANSLIAHIPGIVISAGKTGGRQLLERSNRCGAGGPPDVYLDGVALAHPTPPPNAARPAKGGLGQPRDAAAEPFDLQEFNLESLAGIEYYATSSEAPMQFSHTSSACGMLLLWTRER